MPDFPKASKVSTHVSTPPLFERFNEVLAKKRRKGLTAYAAMHMIYSYAAMHMNPIGSPLDPDLQNLDQRFNDRRHRRLLCSFASFTQRTNGLPAIQSWGTSSPVLRMTYGEE